MWAQKPDLHVSVDRFVLGSKDIFFPINAGSTAHRQVLSSPSSTVEVDNCRGLVHSPLSASSDGSFTASSTQFDDPAALPKYKPNRSSSEIALEKYQSSAAMSGDWWASEEHELSPWRSSVSPQPEASQLVDMEVAEWSPELAALAPDSAFSDQQQTQKQQLDEAINYCDQRIFNYNRDHTFGDSDIVGDVALESLSSCNVGWTSLLLECAGSEAKPNIQNSSAAESLREALYPRQPLDTYTSRLLDLDSWTSFPPQEPYSTGIDSFKFDTMADKIKLEPDVFYGRSNCGIPPQSLSSSQKISPRAENADFHVVQDRELPQLHSFSSKDVPIQWSTSQSSRLPAMLSQVLPSSSSRQSHQAGSTISRLFFDGSSRAEFSPFQRLSDVISFTKHGDHSFASEIKDSHLPLLNRSLEITPAETDKKRAINSAAATSTESTSDPYLKRPRLDPSPSLPFKVRKEKLGEKITALQQLVSPFGKTDTASVLMEAIGYIKFLHEQVQVLSKPYMKSISTSRQNVQEGGKSSWDSDMAKGDGEEPKPDLRSRGLCLVPVSSTQQLANDNGADYWTPAIGGSSR